VLWVTYDSQHKQRSFR